MAQDKEVSDTLGDLTSDAQPAKGMLIALVTYPKEVRSRPGNYITGLNWKCVSPPGEGMNTPEEAQKRLVEYAERTKAA